MTITLSTWNGEVPDSYVRHLNEAAMFGDVDALYDVYNENPGVVADRFRRVLEDGESWEDEE